MIACVLLLESLLTFTIGISPVNANTIESEDIELNREEGNQTIQVEEGAKTPKSDSPKIKFQLDESTDRTQTHTFTLPGLKRLDEVTSNTGKVDVVNVNGEKVTVRVSEGETSRREQTGGSYTPSDTKFVTEQISPNYISDGYEGTLSKYIDHYNTIEFDRKWVTNQLSPNYDSGGYIGRLSMYEYEESKTFQKYGSTTHTVYESFIQDTLTCNNFYSGKQMYYLDALEPGEIDRYEGTVTFTHCSQSGSQFVSHYSGLLTKRTLVTHYRYEGYVTRPESQEPVYLYQGNVTKPGEDTRTYKNFYQYELTFEYSDDISPPSINLSATPSSYTNKDVKITVAVKDEEKRNVTTEESMDRTQTHTFKLPGFKKMNRALVDNGNIDILDVDGENITVKVSGGKVTRQEQTGGSYTPSKTKNVTNQFTSDYSDSDGYEGTLSRYLYSGSLIPAHSKTVTNQQSSYYRDSDGYEGTLSQYVHSGSYTPESTKVITVSPRADVYMKVKYGELTYEGGYYDYILPDGLTSNRPTGWGWFDYSFHYMTQTHVPGPYAPPGYSNGDSIMVATEYFRSDTGTVKVPATDTRIFRYQGTVTRPEKDTRVYRYEGTVTKPAVDTRTYDDYYQYNVTFDYEKEEVPVQKWAKGEQVASYFTDKGNNLVDSSFSVAENGVFTVYAEDLAGNASVKTIAIDYIDKDAPKITLSPNTVQPTNKSVKVNVTVVDASPITVKKWAAGLKDIKYFSTSGETLQSNFDVEENGIYTVYAKDAAGNESIQTININNVFIGAPAKPEFLVSPTAQTNKNALVLISYPANMISNLYRVNGGTWKEYTGPVTVSSNGSIEAKAKNPLGVWSEVGVVHVTNVDKQGPTIEIDSNPKDMTPFDVEITAEIKDSEISTFYTAESLKQEQVQVFHIPGLKKLKNIVVENGSSEIIKVEGEYVTVKFAGASLTEEVVSGEYIPAQSKFVENQTRANYQDSNGFSGTLSQYVYSGTYIPAVKESFIEHTMGWPFDHSGWVSTGGLNFSFWVGNELVPMVMVGSSSFPGGASMITWRGQKTIKPAVDTRVYRYMGTVTKPEVDTRVYKYYYQYKVNFDYEKNVSLQKWAEGEPSLSYFEENGNELVDSKFNVSENGTYSVYAMDEAGNETIEVIVVDNIMKEPPLPPTMSASPTIPTNEDVVVGISYPSEAVIQEYRIDNGNWIAYSTPITMTKNGTVEARGQNEAGIWSDYSQLVVENIDKISPVINLIPDTTAPTNQNIIVEANITDNANEIVQKKWAEGEQDLLFFRLAGYNLGLAFTASENGTYTVYAKDAAGNESVETITINNINRTTPDGPIIIGNPTTPTNGDVQISISYPSSLMLKQYRINHGSWLNYSSSINMTDIGTVEARGQDNAGNWSETTTYVVNNINKDNPEISLSASPMTPTNQDVTITTEVKDIDKKVFNTTESMESNQTQTFTVPGMNHLKNIKVNSGKAEIINIDGDQVTIKFSGGLPSGQTQTGGTFIPADTKFVTNQISSIYNSGGYSGTLTQYLHSGSFSNGGTVFKSEEVLLYKGIVNGTFQYTLKDVIPGPSAWEYQSFMYEGYIPLFEEITEARGDSPYEQCTGKLDPVYPCLDRDGFYDKKVHTPVGNPYLFRPFSTPNEEVWNDLDNIKTLDELKRKHPGYTFTMHSYNNAIRTEALAATNYPPVLYYDKGTSTGFLKPNWNTLRKITSGSIPDYSGYLSHRMFTGMKYEGYVTSPPVDTRVYRYQGNVTKPAVDTRTYADTYQYSIVIEYETDVAKKKWAAGNQSVEFFDSEGTILLGDAFKVSENGVYTVYAKDAAGNATVETISITNIDKEPPSITLEQIPVRPVNIDVTVVATITDNVEVAEKKYAIGNQGAVYFATGGTELIGDRFIVPDNGTYTVYARDTAGNETVETITISNIDRIDPESATFTAEPTVPTNQDVYVTILYPADAFVREYKIGEDGRWRVYSEPVRMTSNGIVFARSRDKADNMSEVSSYEVTNIDKWAPVINLSDSSTDAGVTITADITDKGSGIDVKKYAPGKQNAAYFSTDGNTLNGVSFQVEKNGTYSVYARDIAGNETVRTIATMKIPITNPPLGEDAPEAPSGDLSFTGNSPDKINPVTVHTPVVLYAESSDDKEHDQRTNPPERSTPANPDKDRHAYILDRPFEVALPTDGQHLDEGMAPGYGNRDFAKYVREKQVRFPFDVYTETKQGFYPKDTWINVPVNEATATFYMPVWVPEGKYTVDFRTFAVNANAPSQVLEEHEANLNLDYRTPNGIMENHVAVDSIEVDVVGRLYDFRVTDILDYQWGSVFRPTAGLIQHTGNYFWVGKYGIDGDTRGNEEPFTLPIRHGSHPDGYPDERKNVAVKTGYQFKFDFKTKGDMFESNDGVRITPSFYFVDKNGENRRPVDIYYHTDTKYFVKVGSDKDTEYRTVKLNEPLRNVEEKQLYNTAAYLYDHPQGDLAQFVDKMTKEMFISNYIKKYSKEEQVTGPYGSQLLNRNLRTFIGPDSNEVPNTSMIPIEDAVAREQMWYGEYSLPADIYVVDKGRDVGGYGVQHRLNKNSPIFLQDGYVIVNFHIETVQDGKTDTSHLQYFKDPSNKQAKGPLNNQWKMEGFEYDFIDPYGNFFELQDGDVIFYHGDQSSYDDFGANVTH